MALPTHPRIGRFVIGVSLASAFATACLPNDTRPVPGSVLITATSDGVTTSGISAAETSDGWSIAFDRVLLTVGNVELDGDHCVVYSDSGYTRVLDMATSGPQKVSLIYALGHCGFNYRVSSPNVDSVLGKGASELDKVAMRTPGSDSYTDDAGIGIYVRGHATFRDVAQAFDITKTFEWSFRFRVRYERCVVGSRTADGAEGVVLSSGQDQTIDIGVSPGVLFGDNPNPLRSRSRFQIFADADTLTGNDDGEVTLDELGRIPLTDAVLPGPSGSDQMGEFADIDAGYVQSLRRVEGGWASPVSLEDYVYIVLFPSMLRFVGNGTCSVHLSTRAGRG